MLGLRCDWITWDQTQLVYTKWFGGMGLLWGSRMVRVVRIVMIVAAVLVVADSSQVNTRKQEETRRVGVLRWKDGLFVDAPS